MRALCCLGGHSRALGLTIVCVGFTKPTTTMMNTIYWNVFWNVFFFKSSLHHEGVRSRQKCCPQSCSPWKVLDKKCSQILVHSTPSWDSWWPFIRTFIRTHVWRSVMRATRSWVIQNLRTLFVQHFPRGTTPPATLLPQNAPMTFQERIVEKRSRNFLLGAWMI